MHEIENKRTGDRDLAALFAAADTPPESDPRFVAGVIGHIHLRQRMRLWVLGGSAALALIFALPALWELSSALTEWAAGWNSMDGSALANFGSWLDQAIALIADFLSKAVRSVTFLTTAILAATILPLLRWLAD
ncbi:MAG: hypothetical protein OXF66_05290 [Gammaproteobacteria bacterium]|nr:hypothetical protein [Gammaproteobacteria bacterium]